MDPVHMRTVSRMHLHVVRMTAATIVVRLARDRTSARMMAALIHILTHRLTALVLHLSVRTHLTVGTGRTVRTVRTHLIVRLHRTLALRAHLALGSVDGSAAALRLSALRLDPLWILVAPLLGLVVALRLGTMLLGAARL